MQTKAQTNQTSEKACLLLFGGVMWSQQFIGSALIDALKNNQTKIWIMYFFSSRFAWFALFVIEKHYLTTLFPILLYCQLLYFYVQFFLRATCIEKHCKRTFATKSRLNR